MNIKKIISALLIVTLSCMCFVGCTSSDDKEAPKTQQSLKSTQIESDVGEKSNVLVVYYSASGNTKAVAEDIAKATNGDLFELVPKEIYTSDDLNWRDSNSRVSREHDDASLRDVELEYNTVENWDDYDTILIGYPIWWGIAALMSST